MPTSSKKKTRFVCSDCGGTSPKWLGRCPACGAWNTLVEEAFPGVRRSGSALASRSSPAGARAPRAVRLAEVETNGAVRLPTGLAGRLTGRPTRGAPSVTS